VCRVYDVGEADGVPYISMEYVDGEDLASLLQRIGRLPADKALEIARKICAGVAAAHDKGVIHRDLKPANIMLDKRGNVVIMDFGLAAIADQLRGAEARSGTPAYMAPEQLRGEEVTARSDIYALGMVLYEMFTGKRAYEGASAAELIRHAGERADHQHVVDRRRDRPGSGEGGPPLPGSRCRRGVPLPRCRWPRRSRAAIRWRLPWRPARRRRRNWLPHPARPKG
jgi:serine/threonine protein kinase